MAATETLTPGSLVDDRYRVLEFLGGGGMGAVYKVADTHAGNTLRALKVLTSVARDRSASMRFVGEAEALKSLSHPNVVDYERLGLPKRGPLYLVMEYLAGGSIEQLLVRKKASHRRSIHLLPSGLSRDVALDLMRQATEGLAFVHAQGIAHRDLKPANMMIVQPKEDLERPGAEITLKLVDFGIASRSEDLGPELTQDGAFVGTRPYAAPEHLAYVIESHKRPGGEVAERTTAQEQRGDLFSLGLVMYELWSGEPLVRAEDRSGIRKLQAGSSLEIEYAALTAAVRSLKQDLVGAQFGAGEFKLITALLEEEPERRPTAERAARLLRELLHPPSPQAAPSTFYPDSEHPPAPVIPDRRPPTSAGMPVWTVWAGLLLGIGIGWLLPRPTPTAQPGSELASLPSSTAPAAPPTPAPATPAPPTPAPPTPAPATPAPATPAPAPPAPATPAPATPAPATPAPATPSARTRALPPAGTVVPCAAKVEPGALEQELKQAVGLLGMPVVLTAHGVKCKTSPTGGVYVDAEVPFGREVMAPASGTFRYLKDSRRPDGAMARCVTVSHSGGLVSKICGVSANMELGKGDTVTVGQRLGGVDPTARLTWSVYLAPLEEREEDGQGLDVRAVVDKPIRAPK